MDCFMKAKDFMRRFLILAFSLLTLLSIFSSCKSEWDTENYSSLTDLLGSTYTFYTNSSGGDYCGQRYYKIGSEIHASELPYQFENVKPGYYADGWTYMKNPDDGSTQVPDNIHLDSNGNIDWFTVSPQPVYLSASSWSARGDIPYTVRHLRENLDGTDYEIETETLYGITDSLTSASAKDYPGFTPQTFSQETISGNGNTVVSIYYERKTITYTFDLNGGTWSLGTTSISGKYGESVVWEIPTMSGYVFSGWNPTLPSTFGTDDESFVATWGLGEYNINFDSSGGTGTMSPQEISFGGSVYLKTNTFTKAHSVFEGWSTTDGGPVEYLDGDLFTLPGDSDVTLYAVWTFTAHILSFDANGGTGSVASRTLDYGDSTTLPSSPYTREHYIFSGWSTSSTGSYEYLDGSLYTLSEDNDVTLYAVWTPEVYKISFSANGGYGTMDPQYISYGILTPLNQSTYTKPGYDFAGWNTAADGSGSDCADEGNYLASEDKVLYAQWTAKTFNVSYDKNALLAVGTMADTQIEYLTQGTLRSNSFSRLGYDFMGWSTTASGSVEYGNEGTYSMLSTSDVTLYAVWQKKSQTLVFLPNGGSGSVAWQIVNFDETTKLKKNTTATRDHYDFAGWTTNPLSSTVEYEDEADYTPPTISIVSMRNFYALWTPKKYKVTFDANGGTGTMAEQEFTYGVAQELTQNTFTKNFSGFYTWNTKADGSGTSYNDKEEITVDEDITLYAIWVSFDGITVTVDPESDITLSQTMLPNTIRLSAPTGYDSYTWLYDEALEGRCSSSGNIININVKNLWKGTYPVTVYVESDGMAYSATYYITVE